MSNMSDQEMEEMSMAIEILTLNLKNALKLAVSMKLEESRVKDKSIFTVIKVIRQDIEEKVGNLSDKEAIKEYLSGIKTFLGPPPLEQAETPKNKEISEDEKEVVDLDQQIKQLLGKKNEIKAKLVENKNSKQAEMVDATPNEVVKVPVAAIEKNFLRREFKIQGIVGELGQKDKLGYQSLISQIESGLKRQYSEAEVVNAVVRAVQPGLQLRSYFGSVSNLSLPKLRKILRFHYHEKSATELYQTLANITQLPKEDPQSFLIRALTVRVTSKRKLG